MNKRSSTLSLILTSLLLCSAALAPVASAQESERTNETAWGLTYDWSNLDEDVEAMTGISFVGILTDVMGAADDAGLDLIIGQATTGESNFVIEQWTEADVTEAGVVLTPQVTEMTISHGVLNDAGVVTSWEDTAAGASFDVALSVDTEEYMAMNVIYTEYLNVDGELVSMEVDITFASSYDVIIDLEGEVSGGGETVPFDISFDADISFDITEAHGEAAPTAPSQMYNDLGALNAPFEFNWVCSTWDGASSSSETWDGETYAELTDECEDYSGSFSNAGSYNVEFSGFPADDFGLVADDYVVSISDSVTDSGSFTMDDYDLDGYMSVMDTSQDITVDGAGSTVTVNQADAFPGPIAMPSMMGILLENAFAGTEGGDSIWNALSDDAYELFDDDADMVGNEEYFYCDNGEEIPLSWVDDGYEDCEDGSDETVSYTVSMDFYDYDVTGTGANWSASIGSDAPENVTYALDWYLNDADGIIIISGTTNLTTSETSWGEIWGSNQIAGNEIFENGSYCLGAILSLQSDGSEIAAGEYCFWIGPEPESIMINDLYNIEGEGTLLVWSQAQNLAENVTYSLDYSVSGPENYTSSGVFTPLSPPEWGYSTNEFSVSDGAELVGGDYCITMDLLAEGVIVATSNEYCSNIYVEEEFAGSERLMSVIEAFGNSSIGTMLESFGENLESRLGDIEGEAPYEDGDAYALYDPATMRIIGIQIIAIDPTMSYSFIGPASSVYSAAPTLTHIEYLVGDAATSASAESAADDDITDLVDESTHDTSGVDIALEGTGVADDRAEDNPVVDDSDGGEPPVVPIVDDDTGSLIPFVSPISVIAIIALAGFALRRKDL